jgi:hypothetical protein
MDAFGAERCLWGSNFTGNLSERCAARLEYVAFGEIAAIFRELAWQCPIFHERYLPKTPNASYKYMVCNRGTSDVL